MAEKQNTKVNPIQVQKYLKGIDYPVDKKKLVDTAKKEGADEHVMDTLNRLPEQKYNSPNDVAEAMGDLDAPTTSEHHRGVAEHHTKAAEHHKEAARHHDAGNHEKAAHHAHAAQGHHAETEHHAKEAAKRHAKAHGDKK